MIIFLHCKQIKKTAVQSVTKEKRVVNIGIISNYIRNYIFVSIDKLIISSLYYIKKKSKNILSVHLIVLTEMDRGTLKKNNRKQKYIFLISFLFVCLSVCMVTLISGSTEPIYLKVSPMALFVSSKSVH